jgi:hypothetical protein
MLYCPDLSPFSISKRLPLKSARSYKSVAAAILASLIRAFSCKFTGRHLRAAFDITASQISSDALSRKLLIDITAYTTIPLYVHGRKEKLFLRRKSVRSAIVSGQQGWIRFQGWQWMPCGQHGRNFMKKRFGKVQKRFGFSQKRFGIRQIWCGVCRIWCGKTSI